MITTPSAPPQVIVPQRTSLRTTDHRRRSLPATSDASPTRRSANYVNVKPASSAVILSLISTLSAISPPIKSRLEDFPQNYASFSTSSLPYLDQAESRLLVGPGGNVYQSNPPSPSGSGFGMDYDAIQIPSRLRENDHRCPNDAAGAPTIRKQPYWSPDNILRLRQSRADAENGHVIYETTTIGSLSIEPGPMVSSTSIASPGSLGQKSVGSLKSLEFGFPKEIMCKETGNIGVRDKYSERQDRAEIGSQNAESDKSGLGCFNSQMIIESNVEKDVRPEPQRIASRASSVRITALKAGHNLHSEEQRSSEGSIHSLRKVPTRGSSLRQSHGGNSSQVKLRSRWSDQSGRQEFDKLSFESSLETASQTASQRVFDGAAENEVSRRIRELKDQKKLRDSPLTIATTGSTIATRTPELSRTPAPLPTVEILLSEGLDELQPQLNEVEISGMDQVAPLSAPSPAIMQRINRNKSSRVSSMPSKIAASRSLPLVKHNTDPKAANTVLPQRTNSRLLRRISRAASPANPEKHKRTFSYTLVDERPKSVDSIDVAVDNYISSPRLSQKITHPQTGRIISFSEVGDPNGSVVFCCVGMGLTRYITAFYDELALTLSLRLITPDRPGVGGSEASADGSDTPLRWPDDVLAICLHLKLTKFSILAHSAGAIYALATALRMPQHIRGRIHLLAPWIPPSQMSAFGTQQEALPVSALPYSQRFLRSLPTTFLRAANSGFLSVTSTSVTTSLPKSPYRAKPRSLNLNPSSNPNGNRSHSSSVPKLADGRYHEASTSKEAALFGTRTDSRLGDGFSLRMVEKGRQLSYDTRLTEAIWNSATTDANPAVDLLICLERRHPIGFRYVDTTRSVVIHHGSKDNRVPVENVKWLGKTMRRCEVRILEGEGHGLMASAAVMGEVLTEIANEWEDWNRLVKGKCGGEKRAMR